MRIEFPRKTVKREVSFAGRGIHSGSESKVIVRPGDHDVVFHHVGQQIEAIPENVSETERCTTLGTVRTIEHLMSALAGLEITDADIELIGGELPILDGGSHEYCTGLLDAGFELLGIKSAAGLFGRINMHEHEQQMSISVGEGWWRYEFVSDDRWPGKMESEFQIDSSSYLCEIAPAKTFVFEEDIEAIRNAGLGLGGNEENALVLGRSGYITSHRFDDEPARHKLLDCIGDLYLAGVPPRFLNVVAHRSGHRLNVQAAARLQELCDWED
jgi:UDP-3-O-[3-hydroxymyristoyl] N-acetylglucosamine deacetylase